MPWKPSFDEPLPAEHAFNAFRDAIARLTFDGRTVGYLAFRVTHLRRQVGGRLWWRRWGPPREAVEWIQIMVDTESTALENLNEGVITETDNEWLSSIRDGEVDEFRPHMEPRRYHVEWLTGRERDLAWDEYGFAGPR